MGFQDCIAADEQQYVEIATRLGKDREYREQIRRRIRETKHHIFRDERAVREHERIFCELVSREASR